MLVSDIVEYSARRHPDRPALLGEDETVTYGELRDRARRLANALQTIGAPGDRVALVSTNRSEYLDCYYGVPMAGMALTIVNYRLHVDEMVRLIEHAEATVVVAGQPYLDELVKRRSELPTVHTVIALDGDGGDMRYADFVGEAPATEPAARPDPDDTAWLVYTSGTTGRPKGVMLSHRNLLTGVVSSLTVWDLPEATVFLYCFPLCHVSGYVVLLNHLRGCTVGVLRAYDNDEFLRRVSEWKVTQTGLAPTMINFLLRHPDIDSYDLGALEAIGYGSAAIPAEVLREGLSRLRCDFYQGFGMTELGGNVLHFDAAAHRRAADGDEGLLAAAGKPMLLADLRIVDDDMRDVPAGAVGELVVRGDQVMRGYWREPELTAESFTDGWFHTGDLVRQDTEGFIYIVDRKKDMIVTGGENVASRDVEQAIHRHPAVAEAAVVGVPDPTWGELVCAVVVLRESASATAEEIVEVCREQVGGYQVPRRVEFVDELPKNVAGKVLKREIRQRLVVA